MPETEAFIRETVQRLQESDFAFTVTAHGPPWDVYRFIRQGKRGTVALRMVEKRLEIGLFRAGELGPEEVVKVLLEDSPN